MSQGPCDHLAMDWLRQLLLGKPGRPAALITGVVGHEEDGGWSVFFISEGLEPAKVRAWTLTEVIDGASAAVATLYAGHPPVDDAELQLAIYPWNYDGGAIFDIAGQQGSFSAWDIQGSDLAVRGATLEDLVTAGRTDGRSVSERGDVSMDPPHRIAAHSSDFTAVRMRRRLHSGRFL
jgi:hypothetical protein